MKKKCSALGLALVLALSLLVLPANAAGLTFTDQKDIRYPDAVAACVECNIIGGMPDGSFQPNQPVTRGQMAKMICSAINGGKLTSFEQFFEPPIPPTFYDIAGEWAAKYIEYCAALEIVGGKGDGSFGPRDPVTGVQAAKMLLTALGYDAQLEKFTGPDWAKNIIFCAEQNNLFWGLGVSFNPNVPLTRDQTACMVNNTLNATAVYYDYDTPTPTLTNEGHTFRELYYDIPAQNELAGLIFDLDGRALITYYGDKDFYAINMGSDLTFTGYARELSRKDANAINYCSFAGSFSNLKKCSDHIFEATLIRFDNNKTDIDYREEGFTTNYAAPWGMAVGDRIQIYLPGTPVSELPPATHRWLQGILPLDAVETLPAHVIYDVSSDLAVYNENSARG